VRGETKNAERTPTVALFLIVIFVKLVVKIDLKEDIGLFEE
jgi:hypothetical protein